MATAGSVLKKEREKRKLSLNDISEETKININYLKAIEADDYSIFPGETYIIGFIRNYARALGLDPLEIVSLYKSSKIQEFTQKENIEEKIEYVKPTPKPKKEVSKKIEPIDLNVTEINENELPEIKPRRKIKSEETTEEVKPLSPIPIKPKIFINPVLIFVALGAILFITLLFIFIKNISRSKSKDIYVDLAELKYLEFERDILKYDFALSEYYKIKLGDKFHAVMFEKSVPLQEKKEQTTFTNFLFYFDGDMLTEVTLNKTKPVDFDMDGTLDLEIKVNSLNNELLNAEIKKLHEFVTISNLAQTSNVTSTNKMLSKVGKTNLKPIPVKQKIIFEGIVKERTYVKAFIDGVEQEGKIYYPKEKIYFEANDVMQLKIGNAGGIDVKINGKPYKIGRRGEIANKVIKWEQDPYDNAAYNLVIKDWQ